VIVSPYRACPTRTRSHRASLWRRVQAVCFRYVVQRLELRRLLRLDFAHVADPHARYVAMRDRRLELTVRAVVAGHGDALSWRRREVARLDLEAT
jgi:hypothetical protein